MIIDLVKFPRSRSICKISPKIKPNTARFKRTAINSAISYLNKADYRLTGLPPDKFKKGLKKSKIMREGFRRNSERFKQNHREENKTNNKEKIPRG